MPRLHVAKHSQDYQYGIQPIDPVSQYSSCDSANSRGLQGGSKVSCCNAIDISKATQYSPNVKYSIIM